MTPWQTATNQPPLETPPPAPSHHLTSTTNITSITASPNPWSRSGSKSTETRCHNSAGGGNTREWLLFEGAIASPHRTLTGQTVTQHFLLPVLAGPSCYLSSGQHVASTSPPLPLPAVCTSSRSDTFTSPATPHWNCGIRHNGNPRSDWIVLIVGTPFLRQLPSALCCE